MSIMFTEVLPLSLKLDSPVINIQGPGFNLASWSCGLILVSCLLSAVSAYGTHFDLWNSHHSLCNVSDGKWAVTSVSEGTQREAIRGVTCTFVCLFFNGMTEWLVVCCFSVLCYTEQRKDLVKSHRLSVTSLRSLLATVMAFVMKSAFSLHVSLLAHNHAVKVTDVPHVQLCIYT